MMAMAAFAVALLGATTPAKPLLVCTTASSLEGMAFCLQVLQRGEFRVRALCRNLESPRAEALAQMGAEVVHGDNLDPEGLRAAFAGAHGVYGITTWSGSSFDSSGRVVRAERCNDAAFLEESEFSQGLNIIEAAEATPSMRHFILQSMHRGGRESIDGTVCPRRPVHIAHAHVPIAAAAALMCLNRTWISRHVTVRHPWTRRRN